MATKKGKGCEDLEKAGRLQVMQYFGSPLGADDQLWLEHWQALMDEIGAIEYKPTTMFVGKSKVPELKDAIVQHKNEKDGAQ